MARPVNADSAVTFEAIRRAALALLQEEGQEAVSVRRVAERAGVGMGTLRYYFPRREDLTEACFDLYHEQLLALQEQMAERLRGAADPVAAVADVVRMTYRILLAQPHVHRLRVMTSIQHGELSEQRRHSVRRPFLDNTAKVLAEVTGMGAERLRMMTDTIIRMVSWYAATSAAEQMDITNAASPEEARAAIEAHVVDVAVQLVFSAPLLKPPS